MNKEKIQELLQQEFPENKLVVESCENRRARLRTEIVSELSVMLLADTAVYSAILTTMKDESFRRPVITNLNINFLSKLESNQDLVGESWLMKDGKRLIVGEVIVYSENNSEPIAHATCTYTKLLTE